MLFLSMIVLFLSLTVVAQTPAPTQNTTNTSGAVRLNRAPVSKDVLRVHLPRPSKLTLENGLRVLIVEDHHSPMIFMTTAIVGAGEVYDPQSQPGLSEFTRLLLREGTTTRTSKEIAQEVARLGVIIGSSFGGPNEQLIAIGLSDNFDQWFDLYTDLLLHPSFPESEVDLRKQQRLVSLKQQRTNADFLADERMQQILYGSHPAAVTSPSEASVNAMTHEALAAFYRERYVPQNAVLVIAGDVNAKHLVAKLNKSFAGWHSTNFKPTLPPDPVPQTVRKIFLVNRPDSVQTNIVIGNLAIRRRDPDYVPLVVMNEILGGSAAGRLFMNLREAKGYTYGAYSRLDARSFIGTVTASSEVRTVVTEGAMTEFFRELQRMSEQPVSAEELDKAKRSLVASFALSLESPRSVLGDWLTVEQNGFLETYWDTYVDQVMAVTTTDLQRVARKYFDPKAVQVVAVGDAAKIKASLEKWGTVTVYNADGSLASPTTANH
jgi:zinc protease